MAVRRHVQHQDVQVESAAPRTIGEGVLQIAMPPGRLGRHVECEGLHSIWVSSAVAALDLAYVGRHLRRIHRSLVNDGLDSTVCDAETCEVARAWVMANVKECTAKSS